MRRILSTSAALLCVLVLLAPETPTHAATKRNDNGELLRLIQALADMDIISANAAERLTGRFTTDTSRAAEDASLAVRVQPPPYSGSHYSARAGADMSNISLTIENQGDRRHQFASSTCPITYTITSIETGDTVFDTTAAPCPVQLKGRSLSSGESIQTTITHTNEAYELTPGRYRFVVSGRSGVSDEFVFRVVPRFYHEADTDIEVLDPQFVPSTWSLSGTDQLPIAFVIINDGGGGAIGDAFSWQLRLMSDGEVVLTRGARARVPSPFRGVEETTSIAASHLEPGRYTIELALDTQREVDEPVRHQRNNTIEQQVRIVQ